MKHNRHQLFTSVAELTPGQITEAECPSCGSHTDFMFIGVQNWPLAVARVMNVNPTSTLWRCGSCQTTMNGQDLA